MLCWKRGHGTEMHSGKQRCFSSHFPTAETELAKVKMARSINRIRHLIDKMPHMICQTPRMTYKMPKSNGEMPRLSMKHQKVTMKCRKVME